MRLRLGGGADARRRHRARSRAAVHRAGDRGRTRQRAGPGRGAARQDQDRRRLPHRRRRRSSPTRPSAIACTSSPTACAGESTVGDDAQVGPWAHLRPGSVLENEVHIGNFVETKKTRLGRGSKANHLSYLGDADIGAEGQRRLRHHHLQLRRRRTSSRPSSRTAPSSAPTRSCRAGHGRRRARTSAPAPRCARTCRRARWRSRRGKQRNIEGWVEKKGAERSERRCARSERLPTDSRLDTLSGLT